MVEGEVYIDWRTIWSDWDMWGVANNLTPGHSERIHFQSEVVGYIPMPIPDTSRPFFGDGDHDFCHGLITMESVEVEPTQKDVTEIEKDIERISSMVRDLQIKRKEVLKKVRQSRTQDIVELERVQDDLVTLTRPTE